LSDYPGPGEWYLGLLLEPALRGGGRGHALVRALELYVRRACGHVLRSPKRGRGQGRSHKRRAHRLRRRRRWKRRRSGRREWTGPGCSSRTESAGRLRLLALWRPSAGAGIPDGPRWGARHCGAPGMALEACSVGSSAGATPELGVWSPKPPQGESSAKRCGHPEAHDKRSRANAPRAPSKPIKGKPLIDAASLFTRPLARQGRVRVD
jgi:hypothetical protein